MAVRVSKPAFNLREKLSELDKPVGLKGSELMRCDTDQEARNLIGVGRKNLFINGNFDIWQRGTSSTAGGYVAADRWYHNLSGASMTFSRQAHTNPIDGSRHYGRIASTSSDDYCGIRQRIEDAASIPEGKVTVSFWARGHVNGNLAVWGTIHYNGSSDVDILEKRTPYLKNDTTFRKYSLTFTIPSHSGKTFGSGSYFEMAFGQGTGDSSSAWTLDISNIQLEAGEYATEFEQRSYSEELALCQRYYMKRQLYGCCSTGFSQSGGGYNSHLMNIPLPVKMRTTPTVTFDNATQSQCFQPGGDNANFGSFANGQDFVSVTTGSTNSTWTTQVVSSSAPYINLSAEL